MNRSGRGGNRGMSSRLLGYLGRLTDVYSLCIPSPSRGGQGWGWGQAEMAIACITPILLLASPLKGEVNSPTTAPHAESFDLQ